MDGLCQNEVDHAVRARNLLVAFGTEEALAEFLHQGYRAAAKSAARHMCLDEPEFRRDSDHALLHDHGWGDCYGHMKRYFLRRAAWLLSPRPHFNGRVGR